MTTIDSLETLIRALRRLELLAASLGQTEVSLIIAAAANLATDNLQAKRGR